MDTLYLILTKKQESLSFLGKIIKTLGNTIKEFVKEIISKRQEREKIYSTPFFLSLYGITSKKIEEKTRDKPLNRIQKKALKRLRDTQEIVEKERILRLATTASEKEIELAGIMFQEELLQTTDLRDKIIIPLTIQSTIIGGEQKISYGITPEGVSVLEENFPTSERIVGTSLNLLAGAIKKGVERAITNASKKISEEGIKKGVSFLSKTAGLAGPEGAVIGIVVNFITDFLFEFIKKYGKYIAPLFILVGIIQGGVLGLVLMTAGASAVVIMGSSSIASVLAGIPILFASFFNTLLISGFLIPYFIGLLSFFLFFLISFIIINTGAFLAPLRGVPTYSEPNSYLEVIKKANTKNSFENSELPIKVGYNIVVRAKKGTLTEITFNHKCEVIKQGSKINCQAPLPEQIPSSISPSQEYTFFYETEYSGDYYKDSMVVNTFEVNAKTEDGALVKDVGLETIIIGKMPSCFNFSGSWPSKEMKNLINAVSRLIAETLPFVSKLCATYPQGINLYYNPTVVERCGQGENIWACAPGENNIYFNSKGLQNPYDALYILAHESSHALSYGSPIYFSLYLNWPGVLGELPICRYGGKDPAEGFAEAIAHYIIKSSCGQENPINMQFVQEVIFK